MLRVRPEKWLSVRKTCLLPNNISLECNSSSHSLRSKNPGNHVQANEPTSLTLIQRLRASDQDAWSRMLHLYAPLVHVWCIHHGVQGADADDLVQEVFKAVVTGLDQFQKDRPGDTFRGWLRGITRHKLRTSFAARTATSSRRGHGDNSAITRSPSPK